MDLEVLDELFPMMCVGEGGSPTKIEVKRRFQVAMVTKILLVTLKKSC